MSDITGSVPAFLSALRTLPLWIFVGLALAGYAVLFAPPFAGIDTTPLRQSWGVAIWAGTLMFSVLSIVGILDSCIATYRKHVAAKTARRVLRFVPLHQQRFWHLAKQQDDSVISQIAFQCQATNTSDRPVQIVKVRLARPRAHLVQAFASLPQKGSPYHSMQHAIPPHGTLAASIHLMARGALGTQGRPIRIAVGITDQFGEEYKLTGLVIETHDPLARILPVSERLRNFGSAVAIAFKLKGPTPEPPLRVMPWTYDPGSDYLSVCESILMEEKRSYAARGRIRGQLGSLNVGLQSEPNHGWAKEGEIPQVLWERDAATPISSPNLDRLLTLRESLSSEDADNLQRFLLTQLRKDSTFADVGYFIFIALHRMHRTIDALTTARACLAGDKVYGYSNILGALSALVSHEHFQIEHELYPLILEVLSGDAEPDFRLKEKINLARLQRIDRPAPGKSPRLGCVDKPIDARIAI
jgi:hypothetical protein